MRLLKGILFLLLIVLVFGWCVDLFSDKQTLQDNLIRLHVVADSDQPEDQRIKLKVRDAITAYIQPLLESVDSKEEAHERIRTQLDKLEAVANQTLEQLGAAYSAVVTLTEEAFDTRHYDTFSLPSGVYDSLRVTIGNGEGANWWCVVFPSLCVPASADDFQDTAASSGFDDSLTNTINREYKIRFFFLDCLGKIENFFRRR